MPDWSSFLEKLLGKLVTWLEGLVVMLPNLVIALVVVVLAAPVARWAEKGISPLLLRVTRNQPITRLLGTVTRVAVIVVAVFFSLGLLKLDKTVTSLLAGVGVVGLALGFAFQDIAANFMAGFMMALYRPFDVGDLVEVGGHQGRIRSIAMRATSLETLDGRSVLIPNKDILQNPIVNYTDTAARRLEVGVGTAYCDDMQKVRAVIVDALAPLPDRQAGREVEVLFDAFGDSSINATIFVWLSVSDELSYRRARSEAMIAIKRAFDANGITIPFPIRTLDFGAAVVGGSRLDSMRLGTLRPDSTDLPG